MSVIAVMVLLSLFRRRPRPRPASRQPPFDIDRARRKTDFLKRAGDAYSSTIDDWRPRQLPNLFQPAAPKDDQVVYLDYAGAALPTTSQLQSILLQSAQVLANPHSTGPAADRTARLVQQITTRLLHLLGGHAVRFGPRRHCGYELVFTSGTTEALRIVGERFGYRSCECGRSSTLVYPQASHTSVVGMRAMAPSFLSKPWKELYTDILSGSIETVWTKQSSCLSCRARSLLVLPAECNFGGDRLPVQSAIARVRAQSSSVSIMLDLAKAAATSPVNLCELDPDFACLSFYKLFGEPTGLGCLLVKRTSIDLLFDSDDKAHYFGGGSVNVLVPTSDYVVRRQEPTPLASLAQGTIHFRGIVALQAGLDELERVGGMTKIQQHAKVLARELVSRLQCLRHANGSLAVELYDAWQAKPVDDAGPTVAFNVRRDDGSYVGYNEVSKLAALNHPPIQLRVGCFCNPGACQLALKLDNDEVIGNYEQSGHVCGDQVDIINGKPTGAIRASFGKDSMWEDVDALVCFLERLFVGNRDDLDRSSDSRWNNGPRQVVLSELYLFPIKSCAAQRVRKWQMESTTGKLLFDREFALVDSSGTAMRLQTYPRMAFIRPMIDLKRGIMTVTAPDHPHLVLSLDVAECVEDSGSVVRVCGNRCGAVVWGDHKASAWFSNVLGVQCWLARYSVGNYELPGSLATPSTSSRSSRVAFANEQPILLISEHAVEALNDVLRAQRQRLVNSRHFRPNLVVRFAGQVDKVKAHSEDGWEQVQLLDKGVDFDVVGPCARCSMVDVDPSSGMKGRTLRALVDYRRNNGQITFGIFLRGAGHDSQPSSKVWLEEGDLLTCA